MRQIEPPSHVLDYWFSDEVKLLWFDSTAKFDQELRNNYLATYQTAKRGDLNGWSDTAEGALALVITLDQFPLNMYRNDPECFSTEFAARQVARKAIDENFDRALSNDKKAFIYMPEFV